MDAVAVRPTLATMRRVAKVGHPTLYQWAIALAAEAMIPVLDDACGAFVPEDADAPGSKAEVFSAAGGQIDPASGEDAEDVAVGEEGYIAASDLPGGFEGSGDDTVGALSDLFEGLAVDDL